MPDAKSDITHYSEMFGKNAPRRRVQVALILLVGIVAGAVSDILAHYSLIGPVTLQQFALAGASDGVLIISIPALLTILLLKTMRRAMKLKHIMLVTSFITVVYAVFIMADAAVFAVLKNYTIAYVVLVLANAAVYGYWFFIEKFVMARRKMAAVTATIQPIINVLFLIPLASYLLNIAVPAQLLLIKLYAGMLVFLIVGYISLFIVDRPLKKEMNISSVMLFTVMLNQLLYDFNMDLDFLGSEAGMKRDVDVDVLVLSGKGKHKAIFVRPDIHYGPFANVGGSITTEYLGKILVEKFKAAPFVLHGAVNLNDNPISTSQVYRLGKQLESHVNSARDFEKARGVVSRGVDGACRAINVRIGDVSLLTLTKAPLVTEDIDRSVGQYLQSVASQGKRKVVLIDAHNSRAETASEEELEGIKVGSRYIHHYECAINKAMSASKEKSLKVGAAYQKIGPVLGNPKDMGNGYTSVCVFQTNGSRFGMVYFDANNIQPNFRETMLAHLKKVFGFDFELYTTDTHSVNSISLNASNTLGRFTNVEDACRVIDSMAAIAIHDLEPVQYNYGKFTVKNFKVWGSNAEETLTRVGRSVLARTKYAVPFVIVAGFIIAAWIIYII